ncbi:probable Long-chain-fatty-acid--CoA ligase 1 [Saccharomycodes ludwigii]|uniref:Probable Long-chain-fatty-acid--CoA ligase 1 n=1 Tax=Saccharomycodes ludwigii TaxID=36035 RepID=A0A376B1K7_9ASCO|nr:hypothetical protein SCDLUD_000733 [Saccharomycodes ludwigii]KAH3903121.1 hypothetical protein SCDLUD_000733 [Saccharomycodes ludwigii]SSD58364.1 probable Long-chain-fatty-acid--CoA ligase 1 [Saccharomycodes ludwigii]
MGLVNVPYGKAANKHETAPRVNYKRATEGPLDRPFDSKASTTYEFIIECLERTKNKNVIGWRELVDIHEEEKKVKKIIDGKEVDVPKTWLFYECSDYKYQKGKDFLDEIHDYGRGLIKIGLQPGGNEKLHIFASTSHKWMKSFLAAQTQGIPVVTAYDTLGQDGLIHSMVQTESNAVFTDINLLSNLIVPLQNTNHIRYIIHSEEITPKDTRNKGKIYKNASEAVKKLKEVRPDLKIYSFNEVIQLGKEAKDEIKPNPPSPKDISCIMYTSGSTGPPKGVVITHENLIAGIGGISTVIDRSIVTQNDRIIAFLPLAHIFEMAFELLSFYWGGVVGYATVKTLSDASVRNCKSDMRAFQPTIMVGVAAVWETVRKGILAKVSQLPSYTQKIFWTAYYAKLKMDKYHIPGGNTLANIIFKKVREATGGNLRYALNGGSPLSLDAQTFISNLLCPLLVGYGLTETVANATVLDPSYFELGVAGCLTGAIKVKLVDVPELGYYAKNNQGEVWIQGKCVLKEYYKNPEETEKAIVKATKDGEDRWFMTGDIGEWTKSGQLKVIDRKKNLVKTLNGEYIALEKLESVYRSNPFVDNICVYADDTKVKPVGIVVPNEKKISDLAIDLGLIKRASEIHTVYSNKKLRSAVLSELLKTGKGQGLGGIELLLGIVFFDGEWTPQSGFVTSAQKLQRRKILAAVQKEVTDLYNNNG